jgi:transposase
MARFPTAGHLASWAGMCPGNHESAGKHTSGRTRHGDSWLRAAPGQAAISASRTKDTYLAARFRRIVCHRGKKRAMVAVGHSILIASWFMLSRDVPYHDLGGGYFATRTGKARRIRKLVGEIEQLGYHVTLQSTETA